MLPWKLFLLRLRIDKEKLRFPKQSGSMPLKLLYDKSRATRELRLQIVCGISPVSVLFETEWLKMDGGGIGSDPCSLLLLRSKFRRLVHSRKSGSWWKPVRKLFDRSRFQRVFLLEFHIHLGIRPVIFLLEK